MLKKAEKIIFYFFMFSIPFQTRIILRQFNMVGVGFSEWLSAFIYGTDILMVALFFLWALRRFEGFKISELRKSDYVLFIFFMVSAASILFSFNKYIGFYNLIKLSEFLVLYFYLRSNIGSIFRIDKIFSVLILSGLFQAALAIVQYAKQSDFGLKYLGEAILNPSIFGVSALYINGESFLRSYGTFPHPNVLAAFLLVAIFALYFLIFNKNGIWTGKKLPIAHAIILFGMLLTFSRTAIFTWLAAVILLVFLVFLKKKFIFFSLKNIFKVGTIFILTAVIMGVFLFLFYPQFVSRISIGADNQAVSLRIWYAKESLSIAYKNPVFGVGVGNFVSNLTQINKGIPRWFYQPVHNIYLLILAETGILGISAFVLFLIFTIREYITATKFKKPEHYLFFIIFLSVLFVGVFDHFLWTLQQGRLIFWLAISLLASVSLNENKKRIKIRIFNHE